MFPPGAEAEGAALSAAGEVRMRKVPDGGGWQEQGTGSAVGRPAERSGDEGVRKGHPRFSCACGCVRVFAAASVCSRLRPCVRGRVCVFVAGRAMVGGTVAAGGACRVRDAPPAAGRFPAAPDAKPRILGAGTVRLPKIIAIFDLRLRYFRSAKRKRVCFCARLFVFLCSH